MKRRTFAYRTYATALGVMVAVTMPHEVWATADKVLPNGADTSSIRQEQHIHEVVVTGRRRLTSVNTVSTQLSKAAIDQSMGLSLASMLEQVSGVSSIHTGTMVAKPVINGMYGNRILIVNNGVRQTGQQWGADHAPEIDKNSSSTIEVVKGAEAVRYGSEALGGIIVMEQSKLPYGEKNVHGRIATMYGSNGQRYSAVGTSEGAFSSFAWRVQGTYANSGDQKTAHYLLNNTGSREFDLSAGIGYQSRKLRAEAYYSRYNLKLGVMRSAQMGSIDLLKERIELGQPVDVYPFSRHIDYPMQEIIHQTAIGKIYYQPGKIGNFFWQTAYQDDDRTENRIRRMNHSNIPAVSLHLHSLLNQLRWDKSYGSWKSEAGTQMAYIKNTNQAGTGVVPIIPNYTETTFGLYAVQKYSHRQWDAEAGVRFDYQKTKASGYDWTGTLYGGTRNFGNFTYSLGGRYRIDNHWTVTSNMGLAWRAPHVYELYSNGNELGSGMFVHGDSTMNSERSYKWVTSVQYHNDWMEARIDGYLQWVDNYIYDAPTHQNIIVISGAYPVFQYRQTAAFFRGIDLDFRFQPLPTVTYHAMTSFIWANERSTGNYLPYIPSTRFDHHLKWMPHVDDCISAWTEVNHRFVARQRRFNPEADLINFAPPSYNLYGLEIGINYAMKNEQHLKLLISADNIFNKEYKEYTNRARYYAHDMGRDIRCTLSWIF